MSKQPVFIGAAPCTRRVLDTADQIADLPGHVLILGETGTGKEVLSRRIHQRSRRCCEPMIAVNCAAMQDSLIESELFGHVRGSFTGACARAGLFEEAHGGTLLLDEIGAMTPALQSKVLRVLQDGQVRRVGSNASKQVDVRVIAAVCPGDVKRIRPDLFYRLSRYVLKIPPLAERMDDLPKLVDHFVKQAAIEMKRQVPSVLPETIVKLSRHTWPGNVRELENVIHRAVGLCDNGHLKPDSVEFYSL